MTDQQNSSDPKQDQQIDNAVMDQVALLSYVDQLIAERNDPAVTAENIQKVRESLLQQVNDAINEHLLNCLSDKETIELDKLLDENPDNTKLDDFLESKIPNIETEIASALLNFRAAYLLPVTAEQMTQPEETIQKDEDMPLVPPPSEEVN